MNKSVVFYGERGLVNSIILDINDDLAKQKLFLKSICMADNSTLNWVDTLKSMKYFVEPSFSEFGSPDLIIKARTEDNENYIIFLEAKTIGYKKASIVLANDGLPIPRYNKAGHPISRYDKIGSKLNVQLAYRYRFVNALKNSFGLSYIQEVNSPSIYKDVNRKLKKSELVNFCFEFFKNIKKYYFVALTNDEIDNKADLFSVSLGEVLIPCIGMTRWNKDKNLFGILTYSDLERNMVVSRKFGYYSDSYKFMLENL